jgi:hypothetical protein
VPVRWSESYWHDSRFIGVTQLELKFTSLRSKDDLGFPKIIQFYDVLTKRCLPTVRRRYSHGLSNWSTISLVETGVNGMISNKLGTCNNDDASQLLFFDIASVLPLLSVLCLLNIPPVWQPLCLYAYSIKNPLQTTCSTDLHLWHLPVTIVNTPGSGLQPTWSILDYNISQGKCLCS